MCNQQFSIWICRLIVSSRDCIDSGTRANLMSFLSQNLMILSELPPYTCRPAGAWEFGVSTFLQTCGISIALIIHSLNPLGLKCVEFHEPTDSHFQHDNPLERKSQRRLGFIESRFQNENCWCAMLLWKTDYCCWSDTNSRFKCYNQSGALNELSNYKRPMNRTTTNSLSKTPDESGNYKLPVFVTYAG